MGIFILAVHAKFILYGAGAKGNEAHTFFEQGTQTFSTL
jgi:hypothetical protein